MLAVNPQFNLVNNLFSIEFKSSTDLSEAIIICLFLITKNGARIPLVCFPE